MSDGQHAAVPAPALEETPAPISVILPASPPVPAPKPSVSIEPYAAVIHFHGIGQQRHYESVAQLVEGLHQFAWTAFARGEPFFTRNEFRGLWNLKIRREPLRTEGGSKRGPERVVYVQAEAPPASKEKGKCRVRFYEAYWAPETARGTTARAVALWLVKQTWRPLQMLFSRWSSFDRIRSADLAAMYQRLRNSGASNERVEAVKQLAERYRTFVDRRGTSRGGFNDFLAWLPQEALKALARDWRNAFRLKQCAHLALIVLLLAASAAAFGLVLLALLWALQRAAEWPQLTVWLPAFAAKLKPTWENVIALVPVVLGALGVKRFLRDHVGDVQQFVSYQETEALYERRRRVIASAVRQLEHVLCDDACKRVLIVSHSLGTAVAFDALRDVAERNIAHAQDDPFKGPTPLKKIEHFVTLGSPIDKINYFFIATQSKYRIYEVLVNSLRGDMGSAPFSKVGRQPHVHWINYWDRGDPISGPLDSVIGRSLGRNHVDNVRLCNLVVPNPLQSHTDYYGNQRLIEDLFWMVFYQRYSFADPPRDEKNRPRYQWLGPGDGSALQSALVFLQMAIPAALVLALLETLFDWGSIGRWTLLISVLALFGGSWLEVKLRARRRDRKPVADMAALAGDA